MNIIVNENLNEGIYYMIKGNDIFKLHVINYYKIPYPDYPDELPPREFIRHYRYRHYPPNYKEIENFPYSNEILFNNHLNAIKYLTEVLKNNNKYTIEQMIKLNSYTNKDKIKFF